MKKFVLCVSDYFDDLDPQLTVYPPEYYDSMEQAIAAIGDNVDYFVSRLNGDETHDEQHQGDGTASRYIMDMDASNIFRAEVYTIPADDATAK